jgi:DnaJ like chaperone protein
MWNTWFPSYRAWQQSPFSYDVAVILGVLRSCLGYAERLTVTAERVGSRRYLRTTMAWQFLKNAVAAYGGGLRSALDHLREAFGFDGAQTPAQSRVAFTIAVVALAAKMSKADGVSLPIEAEAFRRQFQVPESECAHVRRLYELASQDVAGYETYAAQIAHILKDQPEIKVSVLECLFHVASADGVLHPDEDRYLAHVAEIFGLTKGEFRCVRRGFVGISRRC